MKKIDRRTAITQGSLAGLFALEASGFAAATKTRPPFTALGACASLRDAQAIKAAGGNYVEEAVYRFMIPDKPESEWLKKLEEAKSAPLPVVACNSFLPGSLRSTGTDANHEGVLNYADIAFRRGRQAGIKVIVFGSSGSRRLKDGFPVSKADEQFVSLLKKMGPLAEAQGITIAIEPLRRQECNFINTVVEGAAIVEKANHPNIRLLADWYHMLQNGENPNDLKKVGRLIVHTHIAEKKGRTAPGVTGDDFRPFFRAYNTVDYKGRISIEGSWSIDQLPNAYRTIRSQAREA